jgi:hypothetical protein
MSNIVQIKINHKKLTKKEENSIDFSYVKCQVCGENAVGKGYSNRYIIYNCEPIMKNQKNQQFNLCDKCDEKYEEEFKYEEHVKMIINDKDIYKVDCVSRGNE